MHSKTLTVLFLTSLAAAAALDERQVEVRQIEERQNGGSGSSGSGDDYYNSLMNELSSMATDTNYLDYLTATNLPTDYSAYLPAATGSSNSGSGSGSNNNGNSVTMPAMTAAPTMTMPAGASFDTPPPSIESVLATAIPPSYLTALANPTSASSIISEIQHGHYPTWYEQLPGSVKAWLTSHYATAGPVATGSSGSSSSPHGNAAPTGALATSFMGAVAILAAAVML